jgi:FAD/FMN-containing dehydrogenase
VSSLAAVLALFRDAREADFALNAYEFFTRVCLERLLRHRNVRDPFDDKHSHYVLVEIDGASDEARVMTWVESVLSSGLATDGVMAKLEAFCAELDGVFALRYPGWEIALFGHIGDGNLHVNVMKPDSLTRQEFLDKTHDVDRHMFDLVKVHGGSISAEHGIGLLKRDFLSWSRSPEEIALMLALKKTLDPKGIMNPGKIWPLRQSTV